MRPVALSGLFALLALAGCDEPRREAPAATAPANRFDRVSADAIVHGERLAHVLGCTDCHGPDLTGADWSDPAFGTLWSSNLTQALVDYDDAQVVAAITQGVRPDGSPLWDMPAHLFAHLGEDELAALTAYLRSLEPAGQPHPPPAFTPATQAEIAAGSYLSSPGVVAAMGDTFVPDAGAGHAQGRHIVAATCAECHGPDLRGGTPYPGAQPRPDLRIAAAYDLPTFRNFMRTGLAAGDRELVLMSGVARLRYSHFTDGEIDAVHAYLLRVAQMDP